MRDYYLVYYDLRVKYHEWNAKRQELISKIDEELSKKFNIKSTHPDDGSFGVMTIKGE